MFGADIADFFSAKGITQEPPTQTESASYYGEGDDMMLDGEEGAAPMALSQPAAEEGTVEPATLEVPPFSLS